VASNPNNDSERDGLLSESLLFFSQAARRLPTNGEGKSVHANTLWRWATRGLQGPGGVLVKLEFAKCGGRNSTSVEALERFFARLKGAEIPVVLPASKRKQATQAEQELKRLGF
jgi:hypothetical protein